MHIIDRYGQRREVVAGLGESIIMEPGDCLYKEDGASPAFQCRLTRWQRLYDWIRNLTR